jgi:hypothetical protein
LALTGIVSGLVYSGVLLIWSPPGLRRSLSAAWEVLHTLFSE